MFIDSQTEKQPLLESHAIIIAPEGIDHSSYLELSWALHVGRVLHPGRPLELRCCGDGGELSPAFALSDLIRSDGNIDGICIGRVSSAHSLIWASCNRRFVHPSALLGVHQSHNHRNCGRRHPLLSGRGMPLAPFK
jgi:ATP-dependent protease ClpP protease subunit